jgi:dienelactone hydrolase
MPDFFDNNCADISWYPPDTKEKGEKLGAWFENAAPPKHLPRVKKLVEEAEKMNPKIKSWGVIGYCWGGKMVSLIGGRDTSFKAGVQTSPAMVDVADAEKVKIPMLVMPSKDESLEDFKKYDGALATKGKLEYFDKMPHGWMSARGDLKDEEARKEYERGYQLAVEFFNENL